MKIKPLLLILAGSVLLLASCYKSETVYYDQLDVTYTQYDTEFDFTAYTSFWLPDSTILKTNYLTDAEIDDFYRAGGTSEKTLDIVKQKFMDRGYVLASDSSLADFIAAPTLLMVKSTSVSYYPPGWWWGYPGYGWGYPGWGYPGWGYPVYGGSYSTGTLVVDMWDTEAYDPDDEKHLGIVWTGVIDGILAGSSTQTRARLDKHINQLFIQSPYLQK